MRRLAAWRREKGLSNGDLGRLVGASREAVRRWQLPLRHRRSARPRRPTLMRLIELTGGATSILDAFEDVALPAATIVVSARVIEGDVNAAG